jgi:hypothetical protein
MAVRKKNAVFRPRLSDAHSVVRRDPVSATDEIEGWRGVPKTPQGWWTLGLTVMAILIGVFLWLRYY